MGTGRHTPVRTGLEVLVGERFQGLEGQRVGLLCNHTARDRSGNHLIDFVCGAKDVRLTTLMSPEHGIRGEFDQSVQGSTDSRTGLAIHSLYDLSLPPETRYRPSPQMLSGVDTVIFDIQDAGTRFYTYISTLGYLMEEAARQGTKVVVLDRPNPLGGLRVEGPELEPSCRSFSGYHNMPITHGMTVGELALMFNAERGIGAELQVVRMAGWRRGMLFDQTGLPWVNPSPNLRSVRQAALYPGVGLLEVMPLSVGRGTDTPFEVIGAPWMDGVALADQLNDSALPGVSFNACTFTPQSSKSAGERCSGVQVLLWDRQLCPPCSLGIHLACALVRLHPEKLDHETLGLMRTTIGNEAIPAAIAAGAEPDSIVESWSDDVGRWMSRRQPFLLY